jgi:hypothetical protein
MVPIDPKTATMAYMIVVAPEKYIQKGMFSQEELENISRDWAVKNLAGRRGGILRYSSLVSSKERDTLDVMILLGGFSLKDIITKCLQKYYDFKESLKVEKGQIEVADVDDPRIRVQIREEDIETIEKRIKDYIALTEIKIKTARKRAIDLQAKLREWGF